MMQCETEYFDGGRRSTLDGNSALLPSDVIDLAMLLDRDFWLETALLSCDLEVANENPRC